MIPATPVNPRTLLTHAESGSRARPGPAPSPERLRELSDAIRARSYRVPPDRVAAALLGARGGRRG